jgi:hypothetical protein
MNRDLIREHYVVVKNFISPERAKRVSDDFVDFYKDEKFTPDTHVANAPSWTNHRTHLELLCEFTPRISDIVGHAVLPTYTCGRLYRNGCILTRHVDRPACEISVTLHLEGDKEWPFWLRTSYGEEHSVILNPGDAIIYLGCCADHWRNPYQGQYYNQVFLHYVRSRGFFGPAYFDRYHLPEHIEKDSTYINNVLKQEYYELR